MFIIAIGIVIGVLYVKPHMFVKIIPYFLTFVINLVVEFNTSYDSYKLCEYLMP